MTEIEKLNIDTNDYNFPLETATTNHMSNPFDKLKLPGDLPQMTWIEGRIEVLKLVIKDDGNNIHFSFKIKPDDPKLMTFETFLGMVKDGETMKMARTNAAVVCTAIGGQIKEGQLHTRDGVCSEAALTEACDRAVQAPCRFKVKTSGEYTNLKAFELLD